MIQKTVMLSSLGEIFYFTLAERRITMRKMAAETGMHVSTLSRVANGKSCTPGHFFRVAKWCGLSPQQFWDLLEQETSHEH